MIPYKLPNANGTVIEVTSTPTLLQDLIETASSASFSISNLDGIDLNVEGVNIRVAFDGNTPSSTEGLLLAGANSFRSIPLDKFMLVSTGANSNVSIQVGKTETNVGDSGLFGGSGSGGGGGSGPDFAAGVVDGNILKADVTNNELDAVTGISEDLIKATYAVATFTNTAGTQLIGTTLNNFTLNWTYNRNSDNPTSQSINNGIGAVAVGLRTRAVVAAGLVSSTVYTLSGFGDDALYGGTNAPFSQNQTISFLNYRYFGVNSAILTTGADIVTAFDAAPTREFASTKIVSKTFNASAGTPPNYLYYAYPTSFGAPTTTTFNGFTFTDYDLSTVSLTNSAGYTEDYYILRTNNNYSGAGITWAITA